MKKDKYRLINKILFGTMSIGVGMLLEKHFYCNSPECLGLIITYSSIFLLILNKLIIIRKLKKIETELDKKIKEIRDNG